ncbi:MAG: hypothetical protein AAFO81_11130 [Pseudomonadota bacterium]
MSTASTSAADNIAALPILLLVLAALAVGSSVWFLFFEAGHAIIGSVLLLTGCAMFAAAFAQLAARAAKDGYKG